MIEDLVEQTIEHNEMLITKFTTDKVRKAFDKLTPDEHYGWTRQAIEDKRAGNITIEEYIGKIALVHLYEAQNEPVGA